MLALVWFVLGLGPHTAAASEAPRSDRSSGKHIVPPVTIGDFDGDQRPDFVTADIGERGSSHTVYRIAIELSSGARSTLNIAAPDGGLQLSSRDVNGDDWPDVIVTTAWTQRPVAVLLNDGLWLTTSRIVCISVAKAAAEAAVSGTSHLRSRARM